MTAKSPIWENVKDFPTNFAHAILFALPETALEYLTTKLRSTVITPDQSWAQEIASAGINGIHVTAQQLLIRGAFCGDRK